MTKKKIGDLTIREVAKVCQKYKVCIDGCPFYNEDSTGYGSCKPAFMVKEDLRLDDEYEVEENEKRSTKPSVVSRCGNNTHRW